MTIATAIINVITQLLLLLVLVSSLQNYYYYYKEMKERGNKRRLLFYKFYVKTNVYYLWNKCQDSVILVRFYKFVFHVYFYIYICVCKMYYYPDIIITIISE